MSEERIEVVLGKSGGTKVFDSLNDFQNWLTAEQNYWSWLRNEPQSEAKQNVRQRYDNFFEAIKGQLQQIHNEKRNAEQSKQQPRIQTQLENIKRQFSDHYERLFLACSATPFAKFVEQVRKDYSDNIAAGVLAYSFRLQINYQQPEHFRGALIGFSFESGLFKRKQNEAQALEEMRLEWEKTFQGFKEQLQTETQTHAQLNSDASQLLSNQSAAFKVMLEKQEAEVKGLISGSKSQWNDLKKTYDDSLALRSPVTYWTKKANSHFWMSWGFVFLTVVVATASACFLIPEAKSILTMPVGIKEPEKWHPEYWRFAVLIGSTLFCVWVIRILVRLLLSNIHLLTDSRERVTMVQTYLALLRRDKLKDDERMFILQTLFRPTPTGIVKDDAVPLTIVDGITKIKN